MPTVDEFLDGPGAVSADAFLGSSADDFLDAKDKNAYLRTMDALAGASGAVTEAVRSGAEGAATNFGPALVKRAVDFNKLGASAASVAMPWATPFLEAAKGPLIEQPEAYIQQGQQALAAQKEGRTGAQQFATDVGAGFGALPAAAIDIAAGRGIGTAAGLSSAMAGKQALPLGMAMFGAGEGGAQGAAKGYLEGLAMHGAGSVGQGLPVAGRVGAQMGAQGTLAAGLNSADAFLDGRIPTTEETLTAGAQGAAMGVPFGLMPRSMGVERPQTEAKVKTPVAESATTAMAPDFIARAAALVGEDPAYLTRNMQAESGGNANAKASTSSASGLFQFTDSTWRGMVKQYGKDYGLTADGRSDPVQQAVAAAIFTRDNRAYLRENLGREPSDGDLYMAAFLGRGGAEKFLTGLAEDPASQAIGHVSPGAARANESIFYEKNGTPRTLQEVYDLMAKKVTPKEGEVVPIVETRPVATPQEPAPQFLDPLLRPELAALRQDMEQNAPGIKVGERNPFDTRLPSERIDEAIGINKPLARQAELDSIRQDIEGRDVAARAAGEVGAPVPAEAAARINERPALPEGQGFNVVPEVMRNDRLPAKLEDAPTMPVQVGDTRFSFRQPVRNAQESTPEFKNWFGESKAVDRAGTPLVLRHYSDVKGIREFKSGEESGGGSREKEGSYGIWFLDPSKNLNPGRGYGEHSTDVYLSMERPLDLRLKKNILKALKESNVASDFRPRGDLKKIKYEGPISIDKSLWSVREKGNEFWVERKVFNPHLNEYQTFLVESYPKWEKGSPQEAMNSALEKYEILLRSNAGKTETIPGVPYNEFLKNLVDEIYSGEIVDKKYSYGVRNAILKYADRNGYDGAILRDFADGDPHISYVVFNPGQIKSATKNKGTFQYSNPDILFSPRPTGDFKGITPEEVQRGISGYTKAAPGAAKVGIVRSQNELPRTILEDLRQSGDSLIEGAYHRPTNTVWLVADNLKSKSRAGEVWLHENVAHHGLRTVFGGDKGYDKFLNRVAKENKFESSLRAEEHIAGIAEKMNAGEVLSAPEKTAWKQFVDFVRTWLIKNGWSAPTRQNLEFILQESLTRMRKNELGRESTSLSLASGMDTRFSPVKLSQYQIDNLAGPKESKPRDYSRAWGIFKTLFVNDDAGRLRFATMAGGPEQAKALDIQGRRVTGAHGIVKEMVASTGKGVRRYGIEGRENEVIPGSQTLGQILAPLARSPQMVADFESYMIASRKQALLGRNERAVAAIDKIEPKIAELQKDIKTETDNSRRAQLQKLLKSYQDQRKDLRDRMVSGIKPVEDRAELDRLEQVYGPEGMAQFNRMHKDFAKWNEQAKLQPLLEVGALSREAYNKIVNSPEAESYASFAREMDDIESSTLGSADVKRLKGSERKIISPIESAIADLARTVRVVEQLKTNRMLVDLRDISTDVANEIKLWKKGGFNPGRDAILTMENGQKTYWKVPWEVALGINGLPPVVAKVWKYATLPLQVGAKGVRWGTTMLSPVFAARNVNRDQITAHSLSQHGYFAPRDFSTGFAAWLGEATGKGSDVLSEWRAAGGETGVYTALERSAVEATKKGLLGIKDQTASGRALKWASSPARAIMALSEASEQATRIGLYANAVKKGATPGEGMLESRDTTVDFSRAGTVGRMLNQIIPFWNANVQGLDKMARGIPTGKFWLNSILGITAPALMSWALYHNEDWYKELEPWEKDFFLHFKIGDGPIVRLPLAFETGLMFGAVPMRVLDWQESRDPNGLMDVAKAIKDALVPPMGIPGVQQAIEDKANYSFFRDKPLESQSMKNLPPWMRSTPYTSEIAKSVGKLLDYSPIKVENYIRGLTGTLGMDTTRALDPAVLAIKGKSAPPPVEKKWWEKTPVVSGFTMADPIGSKSESVDRFYKNMEEANQAKSGRKALLEAGNKEEAIQYDRASYFAPAARALSSKMSDMRTEIAAIQEAPNIQPAEKRARIDALNSQMTKAAREFDEAYRTGNITPEILFLGEKARVAEDVEQYKELMKNGDVSAAQRAAIESSLGQRNNLVKRVDSALAWANKIRTAVDDKGPKLTKGQKAFYTKQADDMTTKALLEFQKQVKTQGVPR